MTASNEVRAILRERILDAIGTEQDDEKAADRILALPQIAAALRQPDPAQADAAAMSAENRPARFADLMRSGLSPEEAFARVSPTFAARSVSASPAEPIKPNAFVRLDGGDFATSPTPAPDQAGGVSDEREAARDRAVLIAARPHMVPPPPAAIDMPQRQGRRYRIDHDGFVGEVIGSYTRRDGKRGAVLQQDGTDVVHVYGERFLTNELPVTGKTAAPEGGPGRPSTSAAPASREEAGAAVDALVTATAARVYGTASDYLSSFNAARAHVLDLMTGGGSGSRDAEAER